MSHILMQVKQAAAAGTIQHCYCSQQGKMAEPA
jgi:hypothetical protein